MKLPRKRLPALGCALLLSASLLVTGAGAAGRFSMSYLYFGSPSAYTRRVEQTGGALQEVAPNYFNLNEDGSLKVTGSGIEQFVGEMHAMGVKVVPFLSNHWDRELGVRALENRAALAAQIARAVEEYGLDGVNVDIENVTHLHRDAYSEFVELLRQKLPRDKVVAVAVAANPYGITQGWHGSYDYRRLAKSADYLMLMTYDEHYQGGEPGPVASYDFMERTVQYALKHAPSDKLVLGLPFFGRIWSDSGALMRGHGLSETQIQSLVASYRGTVAQDPATGSAYARITVRPSDQKPAVNGISLTPGSYTIWFESEESKKRQLGLVERYDLLGAGSWSLGQEWAGTWNYYPLWLNGLPFGDAQGHWATRYIISAAREGLMAGVSPTAFAPERPLTRAEAAVVLCRLLDLSPAPGRHPDFSDTAGHWARDYIRSAHYHGLVSGVGGDAFAPERPLSRQELAVMLDQALFGGGAVSGKSPFSDVSRAGNPWSYDAILRLHKAGVVSGFGDGTFRPHAQVTRAQLAVMLAGSRRAAL